MNTSILSLEETEQFQKIHDHFIPKRKKAFQTKFVKGRKASKKSDPILNKALSVLKENNITNINKKTSYIEFHKRNSGFEKKDFGNWFSWHKDDYGAVPWPCYSVIFYLRKDHTLKGGNLLYKLEGEEHKAPITSRTILQFKGDINHCPEPTTGFGCRDIIVVFIKRTKK